MLDNWQRIEQIIKWGGFASVSAFAREIGLNRSENLYQIKRGNNGISKDLASTISARFPEISRAWLLTGEGDMIPDENNKTIPDIPLYKMDAVELITFGREAEAEYYVSFPIFKGSDFSAFTFSTAMEPEIPRGSVLFFTESSVDALTPGEVYLVVSKHFRGIRYVRREAKNSQLRLVPGNKKEYDEVMVEPREVEKLYIVRGVVINKSV